MRPASVELVAKVPILRADSTAQVSVDKLLGRKRPQPHRSWTQRYVKLLVVGDSGLVHPL